MPCTGEPLRGAFDFFFPNDNRCRRGLSDSEFDGRLNSGGAGGALRVSGHALHLDRLVRTSMLWLSCDVLLFFGYSYPKSSFFMTNDHPGLSI